MWLEGIALDAAQVTFEMTHLQNCKTKHGNRSELRHHGTFDAAQN